MVRMNFIFIFILSSELVAKKIGKTKNNQRTNGPVNDHLISGTTVSTKTSFPNFDIVLKWVKVNSSHHLYKLCRA